MPNPFLLFFSFLVSLTLSHPGAQQGSYTPQDKMHVTACLAGQKEEVEVGEDCRSLQALREAIVVALPQLCVEGFDLSVGGRALDSEEGAVSLEEHASLDVVANTRGLSVLALREAGRAVSEAGLLTAAGKGDVALCTLFLDAGVPIDCVNTSGFTPLLRACRDGHVDASAVEQGSPTEPQDEGVDVDEDVDGDDDEEDGDDEEQDEEEDEDAGNGDDDEQDVQDDDRREDVSREESEEETPQGPDRGRHASIRSGKKIRIFGDSRLVLQQVDGKWACAPQLWPYCAAAQVRV